MFQCCIQVELNLEGMGKGMWQSQGWALRRGDGIRRVLLEILHCRLWSRWCSVCLFFSQLILTWRTFDKNISLISFLLLSLKTSYILLNSLMIVVLCPYFSIVEAPWLVLTLLPSLSHMGRSFLPRALAVGRSIPTPWLFGVILLCWETLMMLWHSFGCPNVLLCFCCSCFISIFWFTGGDCWWFWWHCTNSKIFCAKLTWIFGLFSGKTSGLGAGAAERLVLPGHPHDGNCPRAPLMRTWSLGRLFQRRKKPGFELSVLCWLFFILFLELGWSGFLCSRNPGFN